MVYVLAATTPAGEVGEVQLPRYVLSAAPTAGVAISGLGAVLCDWLYAEDTQVVGKYDQWGGG